MTGIIGPLLACLNRTRSSDRGYTAPINESDKTTWAGSEFLTASRSEQRWSVASGWKESRGGWHGSGQVSRGDRPSFELT